MQYIPPNSWPEIFLLHKIQNPKNIVLPANISNKKKMNNWKNPAHATQAQIETIIYNLSDKSIIMWFMSTKKLYQDL